MNFYYYLFWGSSFVMQYSTITSIFKRGYYIYILRWKELYHQKKIDSSDLSDLSDLIDLIDLIDLMLINQSHILFFFHTLASIVFTWQFSSSATLHFIPPYALQHNWTISFNHWCIR
jgi:hypothetical protein